MRPWARAGVAAVLIATWSVAGWTEIAHAQPAYDTPAPSGFDLVPRSGATGELSFWAAGRDDDRAGHFSGMLRLGMIVEDAPLVDLLEVGLVAGFAWTDFGEDLVLDLGAESNHGAAANTMVSLTGVAGERVWRLRYGLGVVFPSGLSSDPARAAAFYGAAVRGLAEPWLWAADRLSVVPTLQLQLVPIEPLYLEASAQTGFMFSTRPGNVMRDVRNIVDDFAIAEGGRFDVSIDLHAAVGLRHENVLGGLRFRSVITPTLSRDISQLSLEAFLRGTYRIEESTIELFFESRFTANLDPSLGFAFDELGVWGTHFAFGLSSTPQEIPDGRYGVRDIHWEGVDDMDELATEACLGTRRRPILNIDFGLQGEPTCGVPPFDADHAIVEIFTWPITEWPLFDENVFERDVERVERWFRARGYYEARVTESRVEPPQAMTIDREGHGCGDGEGNCEVDVYFSVEEGEPVEIARMSLRGIDELPDGMRDLLRNQLPFSRGDRFDEALYERTKRDMVGALAEAGYAHARVDGEVKVNTNRHEAFIVFTIDAGAPNVIGEVCVVGFENLPAEPLLNVSGLEAGEQFSLSALEDAQRALYSLGVLGAVEVHPAPHEDPEGAAEAVVEDDEGEVPELDEEQTAQLGTEQRTAGRRVCADPPDQIREGYEAADILIEVTPGRQQRYGFGGGFQAGQAVSFGTVTTVSQLQQAAQWDLHLSLSAEHRNLLDNMIRTRIEVRPRLLFDMPFLSFQLAEPFPVGALINGSARWPAFANVRWLNLLHQIRVELGPAPFTQFFRLELDGLFGPEASFFNDRLYFGLFVHANYYQPIDRQPILPEDQLPETYATWLEETIRVDLRDDARSPTLGAYFAVTSQQSVQPLSNWTLIRLTAEARGYVPLFAGIVLAGRFQLGLMHVFDYDQGRFNEDSVYQLHQLGPTALHLTGGGASSNRGFLPGLLGDATQEYVTEARSDEELVNGIPVRQRPVRISGGERLWLASLEIRIPVTENFGVVAFGDVGDVDRRRGGETSVDWRWSHIQLAVGLGIRYRTIIGPLRFDVAVRPDQTLVVGDDSSLPAPCRDDAAGGCRPRSTYFQIGDLAIPGAFHLTIGESF